MKKPINNQQDNTHRMTIRYPPAYHEYLEHLSFKTGLSIVQLIRLLIHLAPDNDEFNKTIIPYISKARAKYVVISDWRDKDFMWKRG